MPYDHVPAEKCISGGHVGCARCPLLQSVLYVNSRRLRIMALACFGDCSLPSNISCARIDISDALIISVVLNALCANTNISVIPVHKITCSVSGAGGRPPLAK